MAFTPVDSISKAVEVHKFNGSLLPEFQRHDQLELSWLRDASHYSLHINTVSFLTDSSYIISDAVPRKTRPSPTQ